MNFMSAQWKRGEGKHQKRAKPADYAWWRLSKPQPRLKFKLRPSWYTLVDRVLYTGGRV